MSEQPGHPAPEGDRTDGRPAGASPAPQPGSSGGEQRPGPAGPAGREETPGRPDLPERTGGGEPAEQRPGEVGTPGRPELPERSGGAGPWQPGQGQPGQGQPQGPPQNPWGRPGQPQGKPGPRPGERTSWRSLWLGGLALLTAFFFYPLGLVLGVAAVVVGVRSRRTARREHGSAPGAAAGIVLGSIGLVLASLSVALTAFLWTELSGYQSCVGSANTGIDRQTCQDEWFPKIEDKMGLPEGSMDEYGDLL